MIRQNNRPYFRYNIEQLQNLAEENNNNLEILNLIVMELECRSTKKAMILLEKTSNYLSKNKNIVSLKEKVNNQNSDSQHFSEKIINNKQAIEKDSQFQRCVQVEKVNDNKIISKDVDVNHHQHATQTVEQSSHISECMHKVQTYSQLPEIKRINEQVNSLRIDKNNDPLSILSSWSALEALAPQTYKKPEDLANGDRNNIINTTHTGLPWLQQQKSRPNYKIYYQVCLGSISMSEAIKDLIKVFGRDEELNQRTTEHAVIGSLLVDNNGVLLEENGIAISSFAWALPLTLNKQLNGLNQWINIERTILAHLQKLLRKTNEQGQLIPLNKTMIINAFYWLVNQFELPDHLVQPPEYIIRTYHHFKAKTPPELPLLNSFYFNDLLKIAQQVENKTVNKGIKAYLGITEIKNVNDLLTNHVLLEKVLAPKNISLSRWPSPGGHPLVTLQQAAVNLTRMELRDNGGIIAVNGPPGTGKTTLLRDIVASAVVDRALAMCAFDEPEKAFIPVGGKIPAGKGFYQLYQLDTCLKGHEIVVASSNNKAVENISKELPASKAIGYSVDEFNYFSAISNHVYNLSIDDNKQTDNSNLPLNETWGMMAAVLGNSKNRTIFQKTFWWNEEYGFRIYLKAAKGDDVTKEITDEQGNVIARKIPEIVSIERPATTLQQAVSLWQAKKNEFLKLKSEIEAALKTLEQLRQACLNKQKISQKVTEQYTVQQNYQQKKQELDLQLAQQQAEYQSYEALYEKSQHIENLSKKKKPGLFARLFRTQAWMQWLHKHKELQQSSYSRKKLFLNAQAVVEQLLSEKQKLEQKQSNIQQSQIKQQNELARLNQYIDSYRTKLGNRLIEDKTFFADHQLYNLNSPWLPNELHKKRERLFMLAMDLHKAFINASAQKILHNLSIFMMPGALKEQDKKQFLSDLWSTLFLAVPVISTTFASFERMMGDLNQDSIGWLLIDEAGQALPQAAVGAIARAKRTIVVGDPLQIPPVTSIPLRLNEEICRFFNVNKTLWSAPDASVQTLADRASSYQSSFRNDTGGRNVGIPLLVHRRCCEPMFSISNHIAYDGQMVYAAGHHQPGVIGNILGSSCWFDLNGQADTKWCPDEGKIVIELLNKIAHQGITEPDLFIITPFKIVANELRNCLRKEKDLFEKLNINLNQWIIDRIGTIHTVQGREADSVILVLGAPENKHNGARLWAAGTPNIINVAASRAKQNFYVIGSYASWSGVGHCRIMAQYLPVK
ncbi:DEAD/DEAH box helicase [Gilliamella sp. ESL0250]|uniref:DEAD/DEAH box helicase n=1 Tax=Gilliamella sp. ESL0250 TaxID=2705036 RepID=UPI001884FB90|nr:AAA domain-containing protein [Gilliamella sp. ESL0250]